MPSPVPDDALWHYVVTQNPRDMPGKVVVRGWIIVPGQEKPLPTSFYVVYDTLEAARAELEQSPDLVCVPRSEDDDPVIVETWL